MTVKDIISLYEAEFNKSFPFSIDDVTTFKISSNLERAHIYKIYDIRYSNYLDKKPPNEYYEMLLANLKNHAEKYINVYMLGYGTHLIVVFLDSENSIILGALGDLQDTINQ